MKKLYQTLPSLYTLTKMYVEAIMYLNNNHEGGIMVEIVPVMIQIKNKDGKDIACDGEENQRHPPQITFRAIVLPVHDIFANTMCICQCPVCKSVISFPIKKGRYQVTEKKSS